MMKGHAKSKRHAPPNVLGLINRIYRRQLAMQSEHRSALAMLNQQFESLRTITDHCTRLLREKETLMKMVDALRDQALTPTAILRERYGGILRPMSADGDQAVYEWPDKSL